MAKPICQLTTRFPPEVYEKIETIARQTGASMNIVVIKAVKQALMGEKQ